MTRADIIAEARSWLRTPWRHQNRVKGAGVDCLLYVLEVFERVGAVPHHELVDKVTGPFQIEKYSPDWMMHRDEERALAIVERWTHRVEIPGDGDIVLYRFGRCVSHGGIVDGWPRIIHAYRTAGMVTYDEGDQGPIGYQENGASRIYGFYSAIWEP